MSRPPPPGRPTARPPGRRAAAVLAAAAAWPLVTGLCGGTLLLIARRPAAALALAVPCAAAAAVLAAAALTALARDARLSPAAGIPPVAAAAAAAWAGLPAAGLGWLRAPAVLAAAAAAAGLGRGGLRHRRRRAAEDRIAQALAPELAQASGQVEQVLGALTGALGRDRATAPSYGIARHAAWSLRVTRWDGTRPLEAVLRLPAHSDIAAPDFLAALRRALGARAGYPSARLSPDPLRDQVRIVLDPPPGPPPGEATARDAAAARARTAVAQALRQRDDEVTIDILAWDEEGAPAGSARAWPMRAFRVTYTQTPKVTSEASRELLRTHMSLQLHGEESALRADWHLAADQVTFTRRPDFPALIPHRPVDIAAVFGGRVVVIPHATDEDGRLTGWQWTDTDAPHELMSGPTGTGKSVDLRVVMIEAARQGHEVRGCDPKRIEMRGLRGWPGVTMIGTRVPDMIQVIEQTFDDMMDRYDQIERGTARAADFGMICLCIDEYIMFTMLVSDWHAEHSRPGDAKEHPVFRRLTALLILARGANIRIRIASQRTDATLFHDRALGGARDNLAARVALGRQTRESAQMMFGDASVGRDIPVGSVAIGTILGPAGLVRAKCHWLPDPAEWEDLAGADRQLLLDMLPPGSHWDGPRPWQPPADGDAGETRPDPARRLLFFIRAALRTREAYLTDGTDGGPPAGGPDAAFYGWTTSPAGKPAHSGTWIGCHVSTPAGPRAYLHPERALEVARQLAVPLDVPFPWERRNLDAALRASGLLTAEGPPGKPRWTVRRTLPGNDLGLGDDRQRVWDIPAAEVTGDLSEWDDATPAPGPRHAEELTEGDQVIIPGSGDGTPATVLRVTGESESDGTIIDYSPGDGRPPGRLRAQPGQLITMADPAPPADDPPF